MPSYFDERPGSVDQMEERVCSPNFDLEPAYFDALPSSTGEMEERIVSPDTEQAMPAEVTSVQKENFEGTSAVEQAVESDAAPDAAESSEANTQETMCTKPQESVKPKTWAEVVSASGEPVAPKPRDKAGGQKNARQQPKIKSARSNEAKKVGSGSQSENHRGDRMGGQGQKRAEGRKYADTHQLFVGNLPHDIEEKELKEVFEKDYGKVIKARIIQQNPPRDVPNFAFVVFAQPETVHTILQKRPIMLRGKIRLNVEEKKQRGGSSEGPRPSSRSGMNHGGAMAGRGTTRGQGDMGPGSDQGGRRRGNGHRGNGSRGRAH